MHAVVVTYILPYLLSSFHLNCVLPNSVFLSFWVRLSHVQITLYLFATNNDLRELLKLCYNDLQRKGHILVRSEKAKKLIHALERY